MVFISGSLTIVFEAPYYQGVFTCQTDTSYQVAKVNFGSSTPKATAVYQYILRHFSELEFYTVESEGACQHYQINPKRQQRMAKQAMTAGIGTKSQQLLKQQYQAIKQEKRRNLREKKQQSKKQKFRQRQVKKRIKHRVH